METLTYTLPIEQAGSLLPLPVPLPGRTVVQLTLILGPGNLERIERTIILEVDSWKHSG
jgi:hypothetical protein